MSKQGPLIYNQVTTRGRAGRARAACYGHNLLETDSTWPIMSSDARRRSLDGSGDSVESDCNDDASLDGPELNIPSLVMPSDRERTLFPEIYRIFFILSEVRKYFRIVSVWSRTKRSRVHTTRQSPGCIACSGRSMFAIQKTVLSAYLLMSRGWKVPDSTRY